jgi:hypothetical protein
MSLEFPDVTWALENRLTKYVRKSTKYIHITTPVPCPQCNNNWMSDLEKASKPVLVPLMNGQQTTLNAYDQTIIAIWFFKTAMVYDLHAEKSAPRPRYFEDHEFQTFMSSLAFYPWYQFYLASYTGDRPGIIQEDHSGISIADRDALQPTGDPIRAYSLTLVIKHLVLQIFCAKITDDLPFRMRPFRRFSIPIGTSDSVSWPPEKHFNDALIDKFIYRWTDFPEPST